MKARPDESILRANLYEEQRSASQDYFGDTVRYLFISISVVMLITLPYTHRAVPFHFILSILGVVLMGICAGLTNARWRWTLVFDAIVAALGLVFFESYAVEIYLQNGFSLLLMLSQLLALLFLFALYFSFQTYRRWLTYQ